jgi:adenylylsulfate kinase
MKYVSIQVTRSDIRLADVIEFYRVVYDPQNAPVYAFSRFGKKPLALLVLIESVASGDPLARLFQRASRIGIDLRGDLCLQEFLVDFYNSGATDEILKVIEEHRPELLGKRGGKEAGRPVRKGADIHVQRRERHALLGQRGCTVWLTGLPCAGKSTTAFLLERTLVDLGHLCYVLDSDNVRHGLNRDLGFSARDRSENIRRVGQMAKLFADAGAVVVTSFISPYRADRELARELHQAAGIDFIEVFVDTPLDICELRDARGLYRKARGGEIPSFTGIGDVYEPPLNPELTVRPAEHSAREVVHQVYCHLVDRGYLLRGIQRI